MTDLTPWLLGVVAVLILSGGWVVAWAATHRDEPTGDIRWDDTDTMLLPWDDTAAVPVVRAALPAVTWVGWGADGWCPLAELFRIKREVAGLDDDGWREWLDAHWARAVTADLGATPLLAGLVAHVPAIEGRRLELEGAAA